MKLTRLQLILLLIGVLGVASGISLLPLYISNYTPVTPVTATAGKAAPTPAQFSYQPIHKMEHAGDAAGAVPGEEKININTADLDQLQRLPRVGVKTAGAIIRYRNAHGPFKTLDDLTAIRGIGPKTVEKFRGMAYCGPGEPASPGAPPVDDTPSPEDLNPHPARNDTPAPAASASEERSGKAPKKKPENGVKININTASKSELITLPRIGPKTAEKIIRYRKEHGPFPDVDALVNVKGIGPKTLERLRPMICVE